MGKQKDFRHVHHLSHKKKDKKVDKTSKPSRSSCNESCLKSIEGMVQAELESITSTKKIGRKEAKEVERFPLLAKAVFLGCERVVDNILEAGENANVQVQGGKTPLIIAVENGYPGIVRKLLKKGADPKFLRQDGRNALMIAVSNNDNRSFTLIWNYWDKSNFCELNHSDSQGFTVLTIAAEQGHSQFTNFLLSLNGIEIDKQTKEGRTPLMFAVASGESKVVQKFLTSGSDIALEDKDGATAVCFAIIQSDTEIKTLLLDCLDSKYREIYVKKRIELLSTPQTEDHLEAISFYKDVLFRVILEIRKSFEDGVALLEKYQVFVSLFKCMMKHQQDTDLLRIGFHLAVCIMYDKAEYSRYIVEELAEQYISATGADCSLKVMLTYRLKSLSDLRGAAFLSIHAGTQCRTGKVWLRANYFQILPFVKEFKLIFPTMTFWVDGENVKARIMFDRFEETLHFIEKDIKSTQFLNDGTARAAIPATQMVERNKYVNSDLYPSSSSDQQWSLVSNSKSGPSKSSSKNPPNQTPRRGAKRKNKRSKLQNKLQSKISTKKLSTKSNIKCTPVLCASSFPALPREIKFSETGYADALKKNLRNDDLIQSTKERGCYPKGTENSSPKALHTSAVGSSSWISMSRNSRQDLCGKLEIKDAAKGSALQETKLEDLEIENREKMQGLWNLWSKLIHREDPVNIMSFFINMLKSNSETPDEGVQTEEAKSSTCSGPEETSEKEFCEREFPISEQKSTEETFASRTSLQSTAVIECCQRQEGNKKALHEIFTALGLEVPPEQNGLDANEASIDDTKAEVHNRSSPRSNAEGKVLDPVGNGGSLANTSSTRTDGEQKDPNVDLNSTFESESSFDLDYSEKDITFSASDSSYVENSDCEDNRENKRKYEKTCLRDLSFSFCKEEVKETSLSSESKGSTQCYQDMCMILKLKTNQIPALVESIGDEIQILKTDKDECNYLDSESKGFSSLPVRTVSRKQNISMEYSGSSTCEISEKRLHTSAVKSESEACISHLTGKVEDSKSLEIKENQPGLVINGLFSNFRPKSFKRKLNLRNVLKSTFSLSFNAYQRLSNIKAMGVQKYILMYRRLIHHKAVDLLRVPRMLSEVFSNAIPHWSARNLPHSDEVGQKKEFNNLVIDPNCTRGTDKPNGDISFLTIQMDHEALFSHKLELSKYTQAVLLQSTRRIPKHENLVRRGGIRADKIMDKEKRKCSKFIRPLGLSSKRENSVHNTNSYFSSNLYGYKPQFINCESSSRWYKILQKIESCVPLSSFLMGFVEAERSFCTDSTMHELVCSSGKIVFSTKQEHTLRKGEHGTYLGLLSNGNPVVVRQFQKSFHDAVELLSKKRRVNHRNITAFYCVCQSPMDQKLFAVTELLEYSLREYLKLQKNHFHGKILVQELVEALRYLHKKQVVHGFLKPSNVMVSIDDRLKLSDFYQLEISTLQYGLKDKEDGRAPAAIGHSLSDFCWRPYELTAAATATEARKYLTTASDIQMAGMLIYFILSGGKHPFGSSDSQCQENIRGGFPEFGAKPADIESRDLIRDMIKRVPSSRPSITLVAKHPYLWDSEKRFKFLVAVSRRIEFFTRKPTKIAEALRDSCIEARDWTCYIHFKLLKYISQSTNKTYVDDFVDLLHFLVGINDNFEIMPSEMKFLVQQPSVFVFRTFPTIFMSVYSVVRDNPSVQRQMSLQAYF